MRFPRATVGSLLGLLLFQPSAFAQTATYLLNLDAFSAFSAGNSSDVFGYSNAGGGFHLRACSSGACSLEAGLQLPTGALIDHIALDYCDTDDTHDMTLTFFECDPNPASCTTVDTIATVGAPGCAVITGTNNLGYTIQDQADKEYVLHIQMPAGGSVAFRRALVFYKLQVSPASGSPTFGDVPTTNPFFRYIEALADSGITGGCGGGNFCPNNPVTRGQMAVFLAKALGLYWAN
jgi:S-layer homology domain